MTTRSPIDQTDLSRRFFLKAGASAAVMASLFPLAGCGTEEDGLGEIPGTRKIDT